MGTQNQVVSDAIAWLNDVDPVLHQWGWTKQWAEAKRRNPRDPISEMRKILGGPLLVSFEKDVEERRRRNWGRMVHAGKPFASNFRTEDNKAKEWGLIGALRLARPTLTLGQLDMVESDINTYAKSLSIYQQALSLVKELRTKINRSLDEMEEMNDTTYSPSARKNMSGSMGDSIYKLQGLLKSGISEVRKQA